MHARGNQAFLLDKSLTFHFALNANFRSFGESTAFLFVSEGSDWASKWFQMSLCSYLKRCNSEPFNSAWVGLMRTSTPFIFGWYREKLGHLHSGFSGQWLWLLCTYTYPILPWMRLRENARWEITKLAWAGFNLNSAALWKLNPWKIMGVIHRQDLSCAARGDRLFGEQFTERLLS